ncbi:hypothetical protein BH09PSE4_BH09PSE4_13940 [soil metagenome]
MIAWALEALIASTLLMAAVLAIRGYVRHTFGAHVAYALWALPLLRMLLPPLPSSWRASAAAVPMSAPFSRAGETVTYYVIEPLGRAAAAPVSTAPSLAMALAMLWSIGAAAFLLWHAVSHLRFVRRMLADPSSEDEVQGVHVIETDAAAGPLAFGIWRKYVAFPRDFGERYNADERDLALAHELGHHQRGDLIANWAALVLLALHWFNPIAWRAFRAFRADQEMANDAAVLAGRSPAQRHAYACAIVKSAHGGAVSAACHLHTINDLKGRLRMLSTNPTSRARLMTGIATVGALTIAGLGLTASGTQAAERIRVHVRDVTGVDLATPVAFAHTAPAPAAAAEPAAAPEPPAPPAPPAMARGDVSTMTTTTTRDGKIQRVIVRRGKADDINVNVDAEISAAMADIPVIKSRNCKGGDGMGDGPVLDMKDGKKHSIIICVDRIDRMSHDAVARVDVRGIERNAYRSALEGVRAGRASVLADRSISEAKRAEALAGMDQAIAELESQIANHD